MASLDSLYAQIPTSEIAQKLGADEGEVDSAIHTLVPVLLGGLQQHSADPDKPDEIVNETDGHAAVATLFGGNDTDQVAAALAKGGAGDNELIRKLLPVVLPIVLAYLAKQIGGGGEQEHGTGSKKKESSGGGLGEILGSILGGDSGDKSLGSILGGLLGGKGGGLGDILGGLLGGRK